MGKFDERAQEGIFLGYSQNSKAFRIFNKSSRVIEESINVKFVDLSLLDITENATGSKPKLQDENLTPQQDIKNEPATLSEPKAEGSSEPMPNTVTEGTSEPVQTDPTSSSSWRFKTHHPPNPVIGNISSGIKTRSSFRDMENQFALLSEVEPTCIDDALKDNSWISAMQDELNQFERNQVWSLIPRPKDKAVIGTKWVFKNKLDENGKVVRNKARLVVKGYS